MNTLLAAISYLFSLFFGTGEPPNELQALLNARNFSAIEQRIAAIQSRFNTGAIDDIELRFAFRDFDAMPPDKDWLFDQWVNAMPRSQFAMLSRAYHHRSVAFLARGTGWARDMPSDRWNFTQGRLMLAERDALASMSMGPPSIIGYYILLDVAGLPCNHDQLNKYYSQGIAAFPGSGLLSNRQLHYLKPRWCGSEELMSAFTARGSSAGLSRRTLQQHEAIRADDKGSWLISEGKKSDGESWLLRAAELSAPFGYAFRRESLLGLNQHACSFERLQAFCKK